MNALKNAGYTILGLALVAAILFSTVLAVEGTAYVAEHVLPFLIHATNIATAFCVVVLLPLSLFRSTRKMSAFGFVFSSLVFGLGVWMFGSVVTYRLWGGAALFVGLMMGFVGVVPLGIIAAALNGLWGTVGNLVYGVVLTIAAQLFGFYLARKVNRDADARPAQP